MSTKSTLIFDEAYLLNDELKEALRDIDGVPNATYVVKDNRVFVFAKLVQLVKSKKALVSTQPLHVDSVLTLMEDAWVSPMEAIELWHIVPEPYAVEPARSESGCIIRHQPFNAMIPAVYDSPDIVKQVLAKLLVGAVVTGSGDFCYKGQPLILCDPLDVALLPERPVFGLPVEREENDHIVKSLSNVQYETGFEPLTQTLFETIKKLESTWLDDSSAAVRFAQSKVEKVWTMVQDFPFDSLNKASTNSADVPVYQEEDVKQLRSLYPELSMLSDEALYAHFDNYQIYCCYLQSWQACRDDDFIFYLLGKLAGDQIEKPDIENTGRMVAFALLKGKPGKYSLEFGRRCNVYTESIRILTGRVAEAMGFLKADKEAVDLRGRPIFVEMDWFRVGRKLNNAAYTLYGK